MTPDPHRSGQKVTAIYSSLRVKYGQSGSMASRRRRTLGVLRVVRDAPGGGAEPVTPERTQIETTLQEHCIRCHGPQKQSGDLRLDQLSRDFVKGGDAEKWHEVLNHVAAGDMPPKWP